MAKAPNTITEVTTDLEVTAKPLDNAVKQDPIISTDESGVTHITLG